MNLAIDIGNTRTKTGLFHQNRLIDTWTNDKTDINLIKKIKKEYKNHPLNGILCTVKNINESLIRSIGKELDSIISLDKNIALPFKNNYETKESLGYDRIAAIAGANWLSPDTNILVIDMGTAITFDIINTQNEYIGGNISPGIEMRYNVLHEHTDKLPKVQPSKKHPLLGKSTNQAIDAGVKNSLLFEIKGYIDALNNEYKELKIFLTGGSTFFFDNKLKNTIFVYPNLGLIGLNHILEYNANKKN